MTGDREPPDDFGTENKLAKGWVFYCFQSFIHRTRNFVNWKSVASCHGMTATNIILQESNLALATRPRLSRFDYSKKFVHFGHMYLEIKLRSNHVHSSKRSENKKSNDQCSHLESPRSEDDFFFHLDQYQTVSGSDSIVPGEFLAFSLEIHHYCNRTLAYITFHLRD